MVLALNLNGLILMNYSVYKIVSYDGCAQMGSMLQMYEKSSTHTVNGFYFRTLTHL